MSDKKNIIFCDFDGTFTEKDIGHRLYRTFAGDSILEIVNKWMQGQISSRQCLLEEAALVRVTEADLHRFLDKFSLREGAPEFYECMKSRGIPFYITSDGADLYIDFVLKKFGLAEIKVFSNHVRLEGDRFIMEFPYENDGCRRCGSCKGSRIRETVGHNREQYRVIFIGDGLSDICALPESDLIFARSDLLRYCRENGFAAIEYESFFDILNYLKKTGMIS
jgi:2,3-diketo-5-methylthio-1-phosphopentane phosphatase